MKAIYHKKAGQLLYETGKYHSNGIITMQVIRTKFFKTTEDVRKYVNRYLKDYIFEITEY